jgi:hypothetical protein
MSIVKPDPMGFMGFTHGIQHYGFRSETPNQQYFIMKIKGKYSIFGKSIFVKEAKCK